jgi:hypothetical protein
MVCWCQLDEDGIVGVGGQQQQCGGIGGDNEGLDDGVGREVNGSWKGRRSTARKALGKKARMKTVRKRSWRGGEPVQVEGDDGEFEDDDGGMNN